MRVEEWIVRNKMWLLQQKAMTRQCRRQILVCTTQCVNAMPLYLVYEWKIASIVDELCLNCMFSRIYAVCSLLFAIRLCCYIWFAHLLRTHHKLARSALLLLDLLAAGLFNSSFKVLREMCGSIYVTLLWSEICFVSQPFLMIAFVWATACFALRIIRCYFGWFCCFCVGWGGSMPFYQSIVHVVSVFFVCGRVSHRAPGRPQLVCVYRRQAAFHPW